MATSLTVHIGARKTGTTFVQRALQARHSQLLDHGILYPIQYRAGNGDYNHVAAVYEVMRDAGRSRGRWQDLPQGTHQGLADAINAHPGPAIISAEALSGLPLPDIETFLSPFTSPIRVIATARDLARVIPSSWQQHVRNTHAVSFSEYLEKRASERADGAQAWESGGRYSFWRMFAYGRLVDRWSAVVGAESVHVVTAPLPGADSSELWRRFCRAAELPAALSADVPVMPALTANTGSTPAEAELLRAFNERGRELNIDRRELKRLQLDIVNTLLQRPDRGASLRLPSSAVGEVASWAEHDIAELDNSGVTIHGDITDLEVTAASADDAPVSPREVAQLGAFLLMHNQRQERAQQGMKLARRFKRS